MFAGLGLAVALALTPAGSPAPAVHSTANTVATQVAPTTDFERGLRAYAREEYVEAVRLFRLAANQGDAGAQVMLGIMYRDGQGVTQGFVEAVRWFGLAAEQGNATGQNRLGMMYSNSWGVAQDDVEAARWFRLAAEQGDALAQFNLGFSYTQGRGVTQNYAEAIRWYRLAADQSLAAAQLSLGSLYANGQGTPQNYTEAIRWFRLAAEQGDSEAQSKLGFLYANGHGVPQNSAEAARWYQLAADQGDARAQYMVGMYTDTEGVPQAPAPAQPAAPASEASETSNGAAADDHLSLYFPTELRPGQPLFDIEMRPDCSIYYRGALIHGPTPEQTNGNCVSPSRVSRSPSGRLIAVFTQFHEYGLEHTVDRLSIVNSLDESVSMRAREIQQGKMLLATNVWSNDESVLFMQEETYFGPDINLLQFDVSLPCTFNISRAALTCASEVQFSEALKTSALRSSPLARCVSNRTCFVHFSIINARPDGEGFAFTGIAQMRSAETEHFSETFVPGEDIVWFAVSGRVNGDAVLQDLTLRVVDPSVEPNIARAQPEAPPPAPASDTPETSAEEIEDGSIGDEEVDVLRPGQSLFQVELRADCSVYYRRTLVQGRTGGEYGEDGNCELPPTIHRSPSGRWIAVHTPLDFYSFAQVSIVDSVAERVAVTPRELTRNGRLFPLNVWSPDENRLLMTDLSFHGPPINDAYQLAVMVLCEFDITAAALGCIDSDRFASILQAAALRASPLARCLPLRSCYLLMDISEPRFEAGELAYTGTVQLKTLAAGASRASGPRFSETFVPGEDIVWFQFSGRGPRSTAQDITLRVLDPAAR